MPKTPISYFGGKQNMLQHILPLIPKHKIYTEAFFGGGAVFFAKEPSSSETINDLQHMVINFYEVVQTNFEQLKAKIESTLFSRASYTVALTIYKMPQLFNSLQRAWAFYIATNMGFTCRIGSWGYDKYGVRLKALINKKLRFDNTIAKRLETTQIENNDACTVIESRDAEDSFHYVDPPYVVDDKNSVNQGHYSGYSLADYERLLEVLSKVKGKFLLSSYPSPLLDSFISKNKWHSKEFSKSLSSQKVSKGGKRKSKVEVLTANYPI